MKDKLLEIQEMLREWNINASYLEEEGDKELEWWGHDGSLNAISLEPTGNIVFYSNLKGWRRVFHEVSTVEDFDNYWPRFVNLSLPPNPLQPAIDKVLEEGEQ